jgi:uncharacterized protein YceH (UPF0502 family)
MSEQSQPRWHAIESHERRALGVLVEKAKTTPDSYPLTLNALRNGCNQKSNRFPQLQLEEDQIEDALENLRKAGAVALIQGDGRAEKYRHLAYDWMGVDKVELAVMAELLLRGAQTVGELRARAARMEPIKGLDELSPILEGLHAKNLIVYLSPPGRGAVVTHNLYEPRELEKVRREFGVAGAATMGPPAVSQATAEAPSAAPAPPAPRSEPTSAPDHGELRALRDEVAELRIELQQQIDDLRAQLDDLNQQLGN